MAVIRKKCWPGWFDDTAAGRKKFELRLNDFLIQPGDTLILEEWDPQTRAYTGRTLEKKVLDVRRFQLDELFWPKEEIEKHGLQVISLD